MKEWQDQYNSFNSIKGLMYLQWYQAILDGKFLPPIEVSVDPVNSCQLNCFWCNGKDVKNRRVMMSDKHLLDLMDFFPRWGAKAICFAGGGEPTLHDALGEAFERSKLPTAIITNGLFLDTDQMSTIAHIAKWIGISVDASNAETYKKCKGLDKFDQVIENITNLRLFGAREVMFKFLIHPINQLEIYDACGIAKKHGAHGIHIRPISFKNYQENEEKYDINAINKQINDARNDYEDESFRIFGIMHKFDSEMHVKFPFSKCRVTPIMPIFQANGDLSICIDRKADKSLVFGRHDPVESILAAWNSEKHKQVIDSVKLYECPKCTLGQYQEQMERAVINDELDWRFT